MMSKVEVSRPTAAQAPVLGFSEFTRRFALPMWGWYVAGFALLAAVNLVNLEIPQLAKHIINTVSEQKTPEAPAFAEAQTVALAIIGLGCLMILIRSLSRIVIFWPGRRLETNTRGLMFARALRLPETFWLRFGMGDLISRLSNDIGQLRAFYAFGLLQVLNVLFLTVFTLVKMVSIHPMLTLVTLLPLAAMFAIMRVAMPRMHAYSKDNQQAIGALTNRITEAFVNVHTLQANAAEASFLGRTEVENDQVYRTNMQMVYVRNVIFQLMTCLAGVAQLAVLFYGGAEVIAGRLSVGDILAFNVYIGLLTFPLTALGIILSLYQRAKTALERLGDIDRAAVEATVADRQATANGSAPALLSIRALRFEFPRMIAGDDAEAATARPAVLSGIDLELKPGQRLGLYGKIGSGKSTIFNLITRLFDPKPGMIFLEGQDILGIEPATLRRSVGYAQQQVQLFSATIMENLSFGIEPPPSLAAMREAAAGAQVLADIEAFDQGWDTEIGERGVRLSGGQKQRLALARLLLRRPKILLLDDVLSAVDQATEKHLLDYLYGLGCAMIIASHRGSALRRCDEILIIAGGRLVDRGTFAEIASRHPEIQADAASGQ